VLSILYSPLLPQPPTHLPIYQSTHTHTHTTHDNHIVDGNIVNQYIHRVYCIRTLHTITMYIVCEDSEKHSLSFLLTPASMCPMFGLCPQDRRRGGFLFLPLPVVITRLAFDLVGDGIMRHLFRCLS